MLSNIGVGLLGFQINILPFIFVLIGSLAVGAVASIFVYRAVITKKLENANKNAKQIVNEALQEAKTIQKEAKLTAQEDAIKIKADAEQELKARRIEIEKLNDRILQREEFINSKEQTLEKKNEAVEQYKTKLENKEKELNDKTAELDKKQNDIIKELEKVAKLTREEALARLTNEIKDEARMQAAMDIRNIEQEAKDNAYKKAQEIISMSIQKYAADVTSESTVTTVSLPNDEMKGRLIGREGRNIKAIENATGIDLIIDDTPEAIVLSGFDPIRREIARISIQKLMQDGRIHPARIEETVNKVERDIDIQIKEAGENAVITAKVHGLHNELVKTLGRLKYRTSYGQNVLKHSIEVSHLAGMMASELGCDEKIARRGGLLHDLGKALDHEKDGTHVSIGVELAKKYKENANVINCIEAHHGDVEFKCVEAVLVQAADIISSSRPGARRESLDNYVKRLQKLEEISMSFKGVEKAFAIQAGREVRIIVRPEQITDEDAMYLAKDIAKRIEQEMEYPGQIKVNVIRESRAIEYAK